MAGEREEKGFGGIPRPQPPPPARAFSPARGQVAITFNDGPVPGVTDQILRILAAYRVHASFFLTGERAERYPALVEAIAAGGHTLGGHGYTHTTLTWLPPAAIYNELENTRQVIRNITGQTIHLFRPPEGRLNSTVLVSAQRADFTTVMWSVEPPALPPEEPDRVAAFAARIIAQAEPGSIILLSEEDPLTVQALPTIIQGPRKRGLEMRRLESFGIIK